MDEDRMYYDGELAPILPPTVLDFYAHVWDARAWSAVPWNVGRPGGSCMVTDQFYPPEHGCCAPTSRRP